MAREEQPYNYFLSQNLKVCFTRFIASFFRNKLLKSTNLLEKETKYDIWRRKKYLFLEETKNGEGKGAKYLEKENIWSAEEKKNDEGKGGKYDAVSDLMHN